MSDTEEAKTTQQQEEEWEADEIDEEQDVHYEADYAKSNRTKCSVTGEQIDNGQIRIAYKWLYEGSEVHGTTWILPKAISEEHRKRMAKRPLYCSELTEHDQKRVKALAGNGPLPTFPENARYGSPEPEEEQPKREKAVPAAKGGKASPKRKGKASPKASSPRKKVDDTPACHEMNVMVAGRFGGGYSIETIKDLINANGGNCTDSSGTCTHILVKEPQFGFPPSFSKKVKDAISREEGPPIVLFSKVLRELEKVGEKAEIGSMSIEDLVEKGWAMDPKTAKAASSK